jgi:DNA-binding LytR/AlgR family response regulator
MEAAAEIRKKDDEVVIVFITNLSQYAIKGYAVGALDYVLKPINYFEFSQSLDKALMRTKKAAAEYITLRANRGLQKLSIAKIKYVESRDHTLIYHTFTGKIAVTGTLKNAEKSLGKSFFRCHSGYLVNLSCVDAIFSGSVIVSGEQIPLSRSRRESFKQAFSDYFNEVTK